MQWRAPRSASDRREPACVSMRCGARIFDLMLKVASGEPTKSEAFDIGGAELAPWVLGATM